jgi:hypothetical protein
MVTIYLCIGALIGTIVANIYRDIIERKRDK